MTFVPVDIDSVDYDVNNFKIQVYHNSFTVSRTPSLSSTAASRALQHLKIYLQNDDRFIIPGQFSSAELRGEVASEVADSREIEAMVRGKLVQTLIALNSPYFNIGSEFDSQNNDRPREVVSNPNSQELQETHEASLNRNNASSKLTTLHQ